LRNRVEDIPLLAEQFLERLARKLGRQRPRLTLANVQQLQSYRWPGNVRELQHVLERASIGANDGRLRLELPADTLQQPATAKPVNVSERILTEAEMRLLEENNIQLAMQAAGGKIYGATGAAALLGMKPTTLASRIKALRT
jgi:transcriptional regulator with GAF, ATPase, and Fis domain